MCNYTCTNLFICLLHQQQKKVHAKMLQIYVKKTHFVVSKIYIKTTSMWKKSPQKRSWQSKICFYFSGLSSRTRHCPTWIFFFFFFCISQHRHGLALELVRSEEPGRGTGPDMSSGLGEGGVAFSAHVIRDDNIGPTATNTPAQTETTQAQQRACFLSCQRVCWKITALKITCNIFVCWRLCCSGGRT